MVIVCIIIECDMAENGQESRVEDLPKVEVDFQINFLIHDWFLIFITDLPLLSLVYLLLETITFRLPWFPGDIFGPHKSNQLLPVLSIWKQYSQCI